MRSKKAANNDLKTPDYGFRPESKAYLAVVLGEGDFTARRAKRALRVLVPVNVVNAVRLVVVPGGKYRYTEQQNITVTQHEDTTIFYYLKCHTLLINS